MTPGRAYPEVFDRKSVVESELQRTRLGASWISRVWETHYTMLIAGGFAFFVVAFVALRHVDPHGIIVYQGFLFGLVVPITQVLLERLRRKMPWAVLLKDAAITFMLINAFVLLGPGTADRAYTVKMLGHLAEAPRGLSREEIGRFYALDFIDRGGVDKRLTEQEAIGTVMERDGMYSLTATGRSLDNTFRLTCYIFVCREMTR